ncbi:GntR family transcriptional regulator [Rhodococcus sp. T2V]|uniref:GntR family transcriptional regulator n=1 Tax=Rhodococcus sp. T2V TaxID=3034164 RepID=UPI0023E301BA|nr:GntR family transcriptional regulator [Rhodococcus sp. T2V]MDF3311274.1 GntR family transcriptional regulator [Rhodococcus sp. T2V]
MGTSSELAKISASARAALLLRRRLSDGFWTAGDRLPSEPVLAEQLEVSRVSLRAALAQLETEGLITRRHGSGTYVNSVRPLVRSLHNHIGTDQLIRSKGHTPGISEMSWRRTKADATVASCLGLEVGAPIVDLYRVRTSDETPVTIEHDYFSADLVPPGPITIGPSLYLFLSDICGTEVVFGVAELEPARAGSEYGAIFGVDPDQLCMVIRQVDYTEAEQPVSYSVEYHLASAFDFQLVRRPASPAGD